MSILILMILAEAFTRQSIEGGLTLTFKVTVTEDWREPEVCGGKEERDFEAEW